MTPPAVDATPLFGFSGTQGVRELRAMVCWCRQGLLKAVLSAAERQAWDAMSEETKERWRAVADELRALRDLK